ncbi:hypothetical protein R50073_41090 [Maricurvus nonylphenolicus]|uniref:hypothetical protein n=1 Tax=Maricurvus nonylphenolicus TaxID=1008307 RepID=UPI0036F36D62
MKRYLFVALLLCGCVDESARITHCDSVGDKQPLCGWQSPEDMELLADGKTLMVSEMEQNHGEVYGHLSLLHVDTDRRQKLSHSVVEGEELWGDKSCSQPPGDYLAPHGIHLSTRADGRQQLLVVNHSEREAIEFYEVLSEESGYRITWKGCAEAPAGSFLNDVVALPDGGFVATHMFDKPDAQVGTMSWKEGLALIGLNPGYLLHWQDGKFSQVEGYSSDYPNGIQISADGRYLFINAWAASTVTKFDWHNRQLVSEAEVQHPDNSQWGDNGKLLIASHDFSVGDLRLCLSDGTKACPGKFSVVELDPETMQSRELLEQHGAPMGAGTVIQEVGETWYIGSFIGDRMLKVTHP